ncbi:MAG: hypothetical protein ABI946_10445, partial [Chthoniobacterales bacterium]
MRRLILFCCGGALAVSATATEVQTFTTAPRSTESEMRKAELAIVQRTTADLRRKGIPPGKYRIGVELKNAGEKDLLEGAFAGVKSPITTDVTLANEEIVI